MIQPDSIYLFEMPQKLIVYIACRSSREGASCGSSAGIHILESTRPMCAGVGGSRGLPERACTPDTYGRGTYVHAVAEVRLEFRSRSIDLANRSIRQDLSSKNIFSNPPRG